MSAAITITFPAIPEEQIQTLQQTEQILADTQLQFVAKLREKYAPLAHLNGYIRTSRYQIGDQNWRRSGETWLMADGRKIKGLLSGDYFDEPRDSQWTGRYSGHRLYLTATGWVEISRSGRWSQYQNSPYYWTCDGSYADEKEFDSGVGSISNLTDAEVVEQYDVVDVAKTLGASLFDLAKKVPERMKRKRALAESLQSAIAQFS